jgi:hypothetical protein
MFGEFKRFRLALLPLLGLVGLIFTAQQASELSISREGWAWIIVACLVIVLVTMRVQERRELARRDAKLRESERGEQILWPHRPVEYRRDPFDRMTEDWRKRHEGRQQERKRILNALRQEYILSHDDVPPGIQAGVDMPPADWMRKRIREKGWEDQFPGYFQDDPEEAARKT